MFDTLLRSLRAPGGSSPGKTSRFHRIHQLRRRSAPVDRRFLPEIETLEDRNLLATASPGVFALAAGNLAPAGLPAGFSPSQIRHAYGFDQITFRNGAVAGDGGGQTIAIIDAYDQPNIASDLAHFDATYGIAAPPQFLKVNESGGSSLPAPSTSWGLEESLDVEWAHAIAPAANIMLVEANSSSVLDLLTAVNYARNVPGVSVVSMSFGGSEWSGEASYDSYFTTPAGHTPITFVASSGDSGSTGAPEWPSVSPNVLAVGGTQLSTDAAGDYLGEIGWSGSGGGISLYEPLPSFQRGVVTQSSTNRTVPDVAYDGSGGSPFAVYDSYAYTGWLEVYGTSCGAPQWSALVAIADQGRVVAGKSPLDGPSQVLPMIYSAPSADFHDATSGNNGGYMAGAGYDLVTGRGSPVANLVVTDLVGPIANPGKPTFTSLASIINPSVYGQPIGLTALVSSTSGTPTGMVAFMDGTYLLGEGTLNYGIATFGTESLTPGDTAITAVYLGDATFAGSTSLSLFQFVFPASTMVTLSSSANPAAQGQPLVLSAAVAAVAPSQGAATGNVYFYLGSTLLGSAPVNGGIATFADAALPVGNGRLLAVYGGDGHFMGAASAPLVETILATARTSGGSQGNDSAPTTPVGSTPEPEPATPAAQRPAFDPNAAVPDANSAVESTMPDAAIVLTQTAAGSEASAVVSSRWTPTADMAPPPGTNVAIRSGDAARRSADATVESSAGRTVDSIAILDQALAIGVAVDASRAVDSVGAACAADLGAASLWNIAELITNR